MLEQDLAARRRRRARAQRLRYALGAVYVASIGYLSAVALVPGLVDSAPADLRWFGAPGSLTTLAVVLALPLGILLLGRAAGRPVLAGTPVLVLAAMAVSAATLGLASFWRCHGDQSPVVAPLSWTLSLFLGNVQSVYAPDVDPGTYCSDYSFPIALEVARLLAVGTTLSTALFAALKLFQSQLDRIAIRRASALTVVVGLDDDALPMITAVARHMDPSDTLAIITGAAERQCVSEARQLGARIRELPLTDPDVLIELRLWKHVKRLYLLSGDPVQNERRLRAIDTAMDALGANQARLPLTVRIDDPWHAEVWRRSFLGSRDPSLTTRDGAHRWVADAVGKFEYTADRVARHLVRVSPARPTPNTVLLVGLHRLTYALTSQLAQMRREQTVYDDPQRAIPSRVVLLAPGADDFLTDHQLRQNRIAPGEDTLTVEPHDANPSVEAIMRIVGDDEMRCAVVLTDPSLEQFGARLANRCPRMLVYSATHGTATLADSSTVGQLFPFPISMDLDEDAPPDAWERAAQLIHENYRATADSISDKVNVAWAELDHFYKQQNRRTVTNTLAMVERVGHTWNTLNNPPAPPLPETFDELDRMSRFRTLGFDADAVSKMLSAEHTSWMTSYAAHGWSYGPSRDEEAKVHNRLLPWEELLERDQKYLADCAAEGIEPSDNRIFRCRAEDSLIGTLLTLRSLGYRSIPKDADQWRTFERVGTVTAGRRDRAWTWKTETGHIMQADAGDWAVVDESGHERSVKPESFTAGYELIDGDRYRRRGIFQARQTQEHEVIPTLEGEAHAGPGDWIVKGPLGEMWPVPAAQFEVNYQEVASR